MHVHTGLGEVVSRIALWGIVAFAVLLPNITQAQENAVPLNYKLYTSVQAPAIGQTPFWHYANTYGRLQHGSQVNWLSDATLEIPYQRFGTVEIAGGAELTSRISDMRNSTHFTQLYGAVRYRGWRVRIGRFRHAIGSHADRLSMGSMMVSRNATPIPKIELSTSEFVNVPLSDEHLQARIYWSEGQLESARHIPNARLHQKSLHFRTAVGSTRITLGLIHNIQWGGENQPSSLDRYKELLTSLKGGNENSLGAYDVKLEFPLQKWRIAGYRQFFLEDGVSLLFRSPWDGLWGLRIQDKDDDEGLISSVLYEFMNTIQQDALPGFPEGRAGYYTHGGYRSGWTYHGNVIGNPLIRNPQYRSPSHELEEQPNTMIIAHHLGIRGSFSSRFSYESRFTYSRNYGICEDQVREGTCRFNSGSTVPPDLEDQRIPRSQLRQDQYATHLDVRYLLSEAHGLRLRSSVAVDWGAFDGTQIGIMLGLQWDGTVSL